MAKKKTKQPVDWRVLCTAILALVGLEMAAMYHGINGKFFAFILAMIAGIAGFTQPQFKLK